MKREGEKYPNVAHGEIWKHFGLIFWQDCLFCQKEFRREQGYRFQLSINSDWLYACESCCCSKSHCNDMIGQWKENMRKDRKGPPAPPPMRSYKND